MRNRYFSYYLDKPIVKGRVFDVFEPEECTRDIAVFFVHGGGWRYGSRADLHLFMEILADMGYYVASADYRLNAKDAFAQIADVREAYDTFVTILKERGIAEPRIAIVGGSAGAHLAAMVAYAAPGECSEECHLVNEWIAPELAILQATPIDFCPYEAIMNSTKDMLEGIAGAKYDDKPELFELLSPKNYIRESNPPTFFVEAEREHLFPPEETLAVCRKHREMGIPSQWRVYEAMEHGFLFELRRKGQKAAFADMCAFLERKLDTEI